MSARLPFKALRLGLLLLAITGGAVQVRAQTAPEQDTEITATSMDMRSTDTEIVTLLEGNVTVKGTNMVLTCDRLRIVSIRLDEDSAKLVPRDQRFKSLVADGTVKITQGGREATCEHAEVLPGEDRITLTGKPMVLDKEQNFTWVGDELNLYRGDRRITGKNVRIVGPPVKDLGVNADKAIAPATTPAHP